MIAKLKETFDKKVQLFMIKNDLDNETYDNARISTCHRKKCFKMIVRLFIRLDPK